MRKKKPVTTKKGQHHKFKSFMMNLVKDKDISKVDPNVLRKHKESFEKKKVTFEKRNADPAHFHDAICHEFPSVNGTEFSLWRLPKNNSTLIPFPKNINNAVALCSFEDLNRSVIYIRLMTAPDEMQKENPGSSNFCEPNTNRDATSGDDAHDAVTEEQIEVSMSREQTMPEHIAKKRKRLSESEDRSKKRKSHSKGAKYEGMPSSSGAVLEEDDHKVASSMTPHSCETSAAVADDVNISSVRIDAGSEKNLNLPDTLIEQMIPVPVLNLVMKKRLNPPDMLISQMTPVPIFNPVMNSQPSILQQFADVASNTNNISVASLPIECIGNTCQEQFLNTEMNPASYLKFLTSGSVNQSDLQSQFTNSHQIKGIDSNDCNENENDSPNTCDLSLLQLNISDQLQADFSWDLLLQELIDSDLYQFPTDIVQDIIQFPNLENVYNLSTRGRQDSNFDFPQLAGQFGLVQTDTKGQGLIAVSSAPTQFIQPTMRGQDLFPVQSATSATTQSHLQTSLHSVALSTTPSIVSRIVPQAAQLSTSTGAAIVANVNVNAKDIQESEQKCRNFWSTLMKLAVSHRPEKVVQNIKNLIKDLIDGKLEPEGFTNHLQKELKSSPQLWDVPFLRKSLPFLRHKLFQNRMTIDGIRPLPASVAIAGLSLGTTVVPAVPVFSGALSAADLQPRSVVPNSLTVCPAQMQPYTTSNSNAGQHNINSGDASIEVPKAELIGEFYCNLRSIIGLATLDKRLYIVSENSETVTICSSHNPLEKISGHKVKGMKAPFQIFASSENNCLYIVDGLKSESKCIWKATDYNGEFVANRLMEDVNCCCLSVTNKGDLVLLDDKNYCLHLYNSDNGRCFRCIHLSNIDRKEFGDPYFVVSSLDNAFYIRSRDAKTRISMVYKISCNGELLNTFGGRSGKRRGQLSAYCRCPLILDRYGRVIVPDCGNRRVLLLNSNLEYMAALLSYYISDRIICYDEEERRLFTSTASAYVRAYNISQFEPDNLLKIATQKPSKFDAGVNEAHMLGHISMTKDRPGKCNIRGVAVLLDKIYILTASSILIHSCLNPFKRIHLEKFKSGDFWDIAADDESDNRRLYVTDKAERCIWLMGIDLIKTKWLKNIHPPYSLSVSKDGSVVIPNNREQSIDIYKGGKTAQLLLSIKLNPGFKNKVKLRHAIKVQEEHYVVCYVCLRKYFEDVNNDFVTDQVLLVSTNGDILRSFDDLSSSNKLNLPNHLAVDREGGIIVADSKNKRVIRLNGKLEQTKILLPDETEGIDKPKRLSYDWKNDQLLVCHLQSLDIFSFSLDLSKRVIDPKLSPVIKSLDLCQDVCSCEFLEFQMINQMAKNTANYKNKDCLGVAILREKLYLVYDEVTSVCVHRSDPPFDLIDEIRILGQDGLVNGLADIVASSAHDRCYIKSDRRIWYLLDGSQKAEEFLESQEYIRSMSVTAEVQLLVVYDNGKLATYNSDGECTECIFPNDSDISPVYGVKTEGGKFICITVGEDEDESCLNGIYERSVDGSNCCFYGPFDTSPFPFECKATTLGEDGQVFILLDNGEVLSYDYKRHLLSSVQLAEDDIKMSKVTGFCYSREKKQLLICGEDGIAFLQILQNKQNEQSGEGLQPIERKKNSSNDKEIDKSSEDKKRRLLYSVNVSYQLDLVRGISRLGNNTYILWSSNLLAINSKDIRTNSHRPHSLTIPNPSLDLMEGGLRNIAASHVGLCLYVTDKKNRCVWSVTIDHKVNKWLDDIDSPYTLSVTEDGSVCKLDNSYRQLDVYDSNAVRTKSIRLPRFMTHLRHAVQTSLGNFVICCNTKNMDEDDDDDSKDDEEKQDASESLLCEVSPEGSLIRRVSSTESSSQLLVEPLHLAIDANDRIFVTDGQLYDRQILLFDNQLECIENITDEDDSTVQLFYDNSTKELLVICISDYGYELLTCLKI